MAEAPPKSKLELGLQEGSTWKSGNDVMGLSKLAAHHERVSVRIVRCFRAPAAVFDATADPTPLQPATTLHVIATAVLGQYMAAAALQKHVAGKFVGD